jgi:hypothetical protein
MKKFFPGFYQPSEEEFKAMWSEGLFVFDTNALLNLYSYPDSAREIFLSVLQKVSARTWVPYQVALEFHRNRFNRIKQSNKPLLTLRDKVRAASKDIKGEVEKIEFEKRNTGIDNLTERLAAMQDAHSRLAEALDLVCERLPDVNLNDPIAAQVSDLFEGRVGEPPTDQAALDALISDGPTRYERKVPPGFADEKEKKDIVYLDRELNYKAMYGDLIFWRQLISHIQNSGIQHVILITGDVKEDWWLKVDNKLLGPHPDLVQELLTKTKALSFWMYRADQFLKYAEDYLNIENVTEETIAQVKQTTDQQHQQQTIEKIKSEFSSWKRTFSQPATDTVTADKIMQKVIFSSKDYLQAYHGAQRGTSREQCVRDWILQQHESPEIIPSLYPDIILRLKDDYTWGYQIISQTNLSRRAAREAIEVGATALKSGLVEKFSVVLYLFEEATDRSESTIQRFAGELADIMFEHRITSVIIGTEEFGRFSPLIEIMSPER